MRSAFLVTFLAVFAASAVQAQTPTLAELAKREEARRKAVQAPTKVLTNDDVKKGTPPAPPSATGKSAAGDAAEGTDPKSQDTDKLAAAKADDPVKDQAYWKDRMSQAREGLRRNEMFAEALQTRINALTADFTGRDDPYQRARVAEDRVKALAELDRLKADIDIQKKHIDEIEEEARRAGVPPGWLR